MRGSRRSCCAELQIADEERDGEGALASTRGACAPRKERGKKKKAQDMNILRFPQVRVDRLHVVQRAALPAREIRPASIDVVARAVVEAGVENLTPAPAGLALVAALFAAFSALFVSGFLTRFFVRHNITFRVVGCSLPPRYSIWQQHLLYFFRRDKL